MTVSLATKNDQSKAGLKPTYRDATKKPDKNISLEEAHEFIMLQLKQEVGKMAKAVRMDKKVYVLERAQHECEKYIKALNNISEGLQVQYRPKYEETAMDSIWDLRRGQRI